MFEILRNLPAGARVLDLGCRTGSFVAEGCPEALIVRLDLEPPADAVDGFVQADAARLPFRDGCFEALIANHSLEHMENLSGVLSEIGRVVRPGGSLYVAVPDASTLSDRLYRWVYHGGGHIHPFRSASELTDRITEATALPLTGTRVLLSSFGFLDRRHFLPRLPRRLAAGPWQSEDYRGAELRAAHTRPLVRDPDQRLWLGVLFWRTAAGTRDHRVDQCLRRLRDGSFFGVLNRNHRTRRTLLCLKGYHCPICGSWNLFTEDR